MGDKRFCPFGVTNYHCNGKDCALWDEFHSCCSFKRLPTDEEMQGKTLDDALKMLDEIEKNGATDEN